MAHTTDPLTAEQLASMPAHGKRSELDQARSHLERVRECLDGIPLEPVRRRMATDFVRRIRGQFPELAGQDIVQSLADRTTAG